MPQSNYLKTFRILAPRPGQSVGGRPDNEIWRVLVVSKIILTASCEIVSDKRRYRAQNLKAHPHRPAPPELSWDRSAPEHARGKIGPESGTPVLAVKIVLLYLSAPVLFTTCSRYWPFLVANGLLKI